jgi:hypothetical protein
LNAVVGKPICFSFVLALGSAHSSSIIVFIFIDVFVIVLIALVGIDALIVISNTIVVIITAVVGVIIDFRVAVGVINLNNWLKLGCTSLIGWGAPL